MNNRFNCEKSMTYREITNTECHF